jgi:hypothetical protein
LFKSGWWFQLSTLLTNISQLGTLFPIYGKIKNFQTTNQKFNNTIKIIVIVEMTDVLPSHLRTLGQQNSPLLPPPHCYHHSIAPLSVAGCAPHGGDGKGP